MRRAPPPDTPISISLRRSISPELVAQTIHVSAPSPPPSHASSISSRPSSTSKQATILVPPPRLHFRTLLPSPPLPPERRIKVPPIKPWPWIWRCHICNSRYSLGVTRRCLEDGHLFCSVPDIDFEIIIEDPSPVSPVSPTPVSTSGTMAHDDARIAALRKAGEEIIKLAQGQKRQSKARPQRKLRRKGVCIAEFDYVGWETYNKWRRDARIHSKYDSRTMKDIKHKSSQSNQLSRSSMKRNEVSGITGGIPNCWIDCNFPSECHNQRKAERDRQALLRAQEVHFQSCSANPGTLLNIPLPLPGWNNAIPESSKDSNVVLSPETLAMEQAAFFEMTSYELDEDHSPSLGPLGVDCGGTGERVVQHGFVLSQRRKSIDDDNTPPSPLKNMSTFSFGLDEFGDMRGRYGAEESLERWKGKDMDDRMEIDVQAREEHASKGRNPLLRRVDDVDERFGDEADDEDNDSDDDEDF